MQGSVCIPEEFTLPTLPPHMVEVLLTESQVERRVRELAAQITRDYPDPKEPLLLVGILKGAALFLADLARAIERPVEIDFVVLSSYGAGTETSGAVRMLKDLDAPVAGKHVLLVDDILDTGLTLRQSRLMETLRQQGAMDVKVCVLLDKPARRRADVPVAYRGFVIDDQFVVGYGMDYGERYRNLRYIGVVTQEEKGGENADAEALVLTP